MTTLSTGPSTEVNSRNRNIGAAGWLPLPAIALAGLALIAFLVGRDVISLDGGFFGGELKSGNSALASAGALAIMGLSGAAITTFALMTYFFGGDDLHPHARTHLMCGLNYAATVIAVAAYWNLAKSSTVVAIVLSFIMIGVIALTVLYRGGRGERHNTFAWAWLALIVIIGLTFTFTGVVDVIGWIAMFALAFAIPAYNHVRARIGLDVNTLGFPAIPFLSGC